MATTSGITNTNYYKKVTVSSTTFTAANDVAINFSSKVLSLQNEGAVTVEYSFDGVTVHGDMTSGKSSASLSFIDRPVHRIWFRVASGSAVVRVEAWATL
jgi:hypothetical protein